MATASNRNGRCWWVALSAEWIITADSSTICSSLSLHITFSTCTTLSEAEHIGIASVNHRAPVTMFTRSFCSMNIMSKMLCAELKNKNKHSLHDTLVEQFEGHTVSFSFAWLYVVSALNSKPLLRSAETLKKINNIHRQHKTHYYIVQAFNYLGCFLISWLLLMHPEHKW